MPTALAALLLLTGCGTSSARLAPQTHPSPPIRAAAPPAHVAIVVMENEAYGDLIGARDAPFIRGLADRWALPTQMYAITHPSLPNYLALIGGSTFGITDDCTDCKVTGASTLVDQLQAAGLSWKAYMGDLPRPCFTGAQAGEYAKKHDPFVYFTSVTGSPSRCRSIVPVSRLGEDERTGRLPSFVWITPNLCHDMHDCGVSTGDRFLRGLVPPLLRALGPRGLLMITWDEGTSDDGCCRWAAGGHIATILAGGLAQPGARLSTPVDHYSVLQAVEDLFGLPRLRAADCVCTPSLGPLLSPRALRAR